jgi:hypothetical protein
MNHKFFNPEAFIQPRATSTDVGAIMRSNPVTEDENTFQTPVSPRIVKISCNHVFPLKLSEQVGPGAAVGAALETARPSGSHITRDSPPFTPPYTKHQLPSTQYC